MALAPKQRKQPIPPQPTPFPSRQGAAAAAAALRVDILRGRVAAGARLEIDEIAARHGLSRTPVRDALKQLGAEGLVQVLSYRGVEVTRLSAEDLRELFAIRIALERLAVAEADGKVSDAELGGLRRILRRMDRTRGRDASWTTLNTSFHAFVTPIGNVFGRNPCASGLAAPAFLPTAAGRPPEESRQQKRVLGST